ncbi:MAG TPA: acyl-CoA dehydrogenase family protein, partial [Gemmataceae bacterium]|nr:acyl-CoA dehydrogenase family protein [Gemmataceae bacterium]
MRDRLQKLLALFGSGPSSSPIAAGALVDAAYREMQKRLEETVLGRPVLRVLAHRFLRAWQEAGKAGRAFDLAAMRTRLQEAIALWQEACGQAPTLLDEMKRRRQAADLFLRWVAAGQISAFALTEPSAGSDTARVATRARLQSVPVEREPDGVLRFVPAGAKEPRYLLDAARLEFRNVPGHDGPSAFYRWSDNAEPAPIRFDEYDYETDDPRRMRYYDHGTRRVHFTDIAQLRERDGKLWYDYWELNGAKMWITNGRMCGIMALYAKTEEGVTGFIVDRHAEGLVVGKDEAKMGQLGSPTNELSLQAVRVPRENVIGLEGRGQVNALETLNVGRAGLAMSAMSQMKYLYNWSRAFVEAPRQNPSPQPPPLKGEGEQDQHAFSSPPLRFGEGVGGRGSVTAWRLARIEEDRFTSEALAHEIIGRFEHKQTKSVRLESAVAKMLVSELLHRVIETAEEIHGLAGQTQLHLVEKRKRDARVLNIYEGTNEIQRFFILRDLVSELAPRWAATSPPAGAGRETLQLEEAKAALRQRTLAAVEVFGGQLAQNPNLQANCFLLAEAVAWVAAANSTLARLVFLTRQAHGPQPVGFSQIDVGFRAFARCLDEIRIRLKRFDEELLNLRRGLYSPAVRAATLLFHDAAHAKPATPPRSRITRPLSILVILDPPTPGVPQPHVADGRLLEPYRVLTLADRAALETALRLRDQADAPVTVQVAAVGPASVGQLLRETISLGVERARLVLAPVEAVAPDRAAAALAAVLAAENFDLILTGAGGAGSAEGSLGLLAAEALGVPVSGNAGQLAVRAGTEGDSLLLAATDGSQRRTRSLPAAVAIEAGTALRSFTVEGYLAGLSRAVEAEPWPAGVEAVPVTFVETGQMAAASSETPPRPLLPSEAGRLVLESIGVHAIGADTAHSTAASATDLATLTDTDEPFFFANGKGSAYVVAVLAAEADGRLRPTARHTLDAARFVAQFVDGGAATATLLLTLRDQDAQDRAVAELMRLGPTDACLLAAQAEDASDEIRARILVECCAARTHFPAALVGEPWTETAFSTLATRSGRIDTIALRVRALEREQGRLVAETAWQGKLRVHQVLTPVPGRTCWIGLTAEVEIGAVSPPQRGRARRLERWTPHLERFYGRGDVRRLLEELKQEAGVARLSDAEFIIDVGFGVGNRDGYEAVIDPLERTLRGMGVRGLRIGGSRKVTEELHLLPADRQIGQSGVSVNPRVLLAIGVSGAPQHLNYIGPRATVVAFNRDAEAPIMTLNQRQARPKVFPVVGDLFETVPALIEALREESGGSPVAQKVE